MELEDYRRMTEETSRWFRVLQADMPGQMTCGQGCTLCCNGLFDISLPDAVLLAEGLAALPPDELDAATGRARSIHDQILALAPGLAPPFVLAELDDDAIDRIVDSVPEPRCPLLDANDRCVVYEHRPLACRLEGVPMIDASAGLFGDWCELNFTTGVPPGADTALRRDYARMQEIEAEVTARLSAGILGETQMRATVFIPSLLVSFEGFWKRVR